MYLVLRYEKVCEGSGARLLSSVDALSHSSLHGHRYHRIPISIPTAEWVCPLTNNTHPFSHHRTKNNAFVEVPLGTYDHLTLVEPLTVTVVWVLLLYILSVFRFTHYRIQAEVNQKKHE